jgi:hypothetical protein
MKRLQVICFYWVGERWQERLNVNNSTDPQYRRLLLKAGPVDRELVSRYVNNLFAGVTRFASEPFDFICFTNEELDLVPQIEVRTFPMITERGVLPRLYMFSKESGLHGHQVLCLDLDVVIVGDLNPLMRYRGSFAARAKFRYGEQHKLDGDIMSFTAGPENTERFWDAFIANVDRNVAMTLGRERYWVRHVAGKTADVWQEIAPGAVLSFKRHLTGARKVPNSACIVSCHGFPRPHQIKLPWIKEYWT